MTSAHILIVEDEGLIAEDIRWQLLKLNHRVVGVADTGEEAVRLAETLYPDLVLMDGNLKGSMDGFEAGRLIEQSLGCPIIYLTSNPQASAFPFSVGKPFTKAGLASAVSKALGRRDRSELQKI